MKRSTILIAEDNSQLRKVLKTVLERAGHNPIVASSPIEALALARDHKGGIDLLLTDVVMPQMNGKELAERIQVLHPNVKIIYMSGYTENTIVHRGVLDDDINFIPKPLTPDQMLLMIAKVLA